ncbi:MAG: trehalose-phosphatase [Rhodoglobus sp.]
MQQFSSPEQMAAAIDALVHAPTLLVALDFDGTLAPEVDDPLDARAVPEARTQLMRLLALADTRLALISGRALDSLEQVAQLPAPVLFAGSHGLEYRLDDGDSALELTEAQRTQLLALDTLLHQLADTAPGTWVENKPAGRALHVRMAAPEHAQQLSNDAVARVHNELPGLTMRFGKNVVEFSLHSADKGDAIRRLRDYVGADAIFFAGDDTTDEDAIAALGPNDLGVRVGHAPSAAELRVAGIDQMATLLRLLTDSRAAVIAQRKN